MARNSTPYTFAIYSNGELVQNVYGAKGAPVDSEGNVSRGTGRNLADALGNAQNAADAAWRFPGLSVMVWRNGNMVNVPSSFDLRALTVRRMAS